MNSGVSIMLVAALASGVLLSTTATGPGYAGWISSAPNWKGTPSVVSHLVLPFVASGIDYFVGGQMREAGRGEFPFFESRIRRGDAYIVFSPTGSNVIFTHFHLVLNQDFQDFEDFKDWKGCIRFGCKGHS